MNLLIMGAPGGGKGTQAEILAKALSIPTISTGAMLRNVIALKAELGNQAKKYIDSGNLVPDGVITGIVIDRLKEQDCKDGYILDGFPRTLKQAESLETAGIQIDNAIVLKVTDEEIINRVVGRRVCSKCGATYHISYNPSKVEGVCDVCSAQLITRDDDNTKTVRHRLATYHSQTEPVINFYAKRDKLIVVEGIGSVEEISQKLLSALGV